VTTGLMVALALQAQVIDWMFYDQDFDDTLRFNLSIDTTDGHGGLWQIGAPQKTVFNAAMSPPNVIVTDTLQPYPPNDTSRFTITNLAQYGWLFPHTAMLAGYFWIDAGAGDFGMIEISFDQGNNWVDLLNDPVVANYLQGAVFPPTLTGSSGGWQYFEMNLANLHYYALDELGITIEENDSIQYRFSFISDDVDDPHDGLMYDNLHFEDWVEAIPEFQASTFHSQVMPNPVTDELSVVYETTGVDAPILIVCDARGARCLESGQLAAHRASVDVSILGPGMYSYELRSENGMRSFGRFVKQE
jgi:hypothetical protein